MLFESFDIIQEKLRIVKRFFKKIFQNSARNPKERAEALSLIAYFFMEAFTMASTSSGVSMGVEISFLGHTAAHRPQEVQRL